MRWSISSRNQGVALGLGLAVLGLVLVGAGEDGGAVLTGGVALVLGDGELVTGERAW